MYLLSLIILITFKTVFLDEHSTGSTQYVSQGSCQPNSDGDLPKECFKGGPGGGQPNYNKRGPQRPPSNDSNRHQPNFQFNIPQGGM